MVSAARGPVRSHSAGLGSYLLCTGHQTSGSGTSIVGASASPAEDTARHVVWCIARRSRHCARRLVLARLARRCKALLWERGSTHGPPTSEPCDAATCARHHRTSRLWLPIPRSTTTHKVNAAAQPAHLGSGRLGVRDWELGVGGHLHSAARDSAGGAPVWAAASQQRSRSRARTAPSAPQGPSRPHRHRPRHAPVGHASQASKQRPPPAVTTRRCSSCRHPPALAAASIPPSASGRPPWRGP